MEGFPLIGVDDEASLPAPLDTALSGKTQLFGEPRQWQIFSTEK